MTMISESGCVSEISACLVGSMGGQVKGELDVVEKALKEVSFTTQPSTP
jgi:hypothetical protein